MNVGDHPAQPCLEVLAAPGLGGDTVPFAVVQNGAESSPELPGERWLLVDDDAGDALLLVEPSSGAWRRLRSGSRK